MRNLCVFTAGIVVGCCLKSRKQKMCEKSKKDQATSAH